jgi:hypothetical protein
MEQRRRRHRMERLDRRPHMERPRMEHLQRTAHAIR